MSENSEPVNIAFSFKELTKDGDREISIDITIGETTKGVTWSVGVTQREIEENMAAALLVLQMSIGDHAGRFKKRMSEFETILAMGANEKKASAAWAEFKAAGDGQFAVLDAAMDKLAS